MTPGELGEMIEGCVDYALTERKCMDTMAANIAVTMMRLNGVDAERDDALCFRYPEKPTMVGEPDNDETVNVLKQWVTATNGRTV